MLSIHKLFEEISSFPLSRALQRKATQLYSKGDPKLDSVALRVAQKAKSVSPKYQALKRKLM